MTDEEKTLSLKLAIEKKLFISGGSDHSGLLGGYYSSYPNEEPLKKSDLYIEPHGVGTMREYFEEIKTQKISR